MILLAIETSSGACSAAVLAGNGRAPQLEYAYEEMQRGHAEALMPMIRHVMQRAGLAFSELDRIGVGIGPGSFTGTRVAIAAARGLALATSAGVVGVSSLRIISESVYTQDNALKSPVAVALPAGRGEIYFEVFDAGGVSRGVPVATSVENAAALLPAGPVVLAGRAAVSLQKAARERSDIDVSDVLWPDARVLAELARTMMPQEVAPVPLYIRAADAKPQTSGVLARDIPELR